MLTLRGVLDSWRLDLATTARSATLGTIGPDGEPHLVPVCFALVGDLLAIPIDEKPKRSRSLARLANINRDPRATLLIDHYEDDWSRLAWVRIDATASIIQQGSQWPEALAALRARYPQYQEMALEQLPLIALTARHVAAWRWAGA